MLPKTALNSHAFHISHTAHFVYGGATHIGSFDLCLMSKMSISADLILGVCMASSCEWQASMHIAGMRHPIASITKVRSGTEIPNEMKKSSDSLAIPQRCS